VKQIQSEGHVLANHTYSHINGLKVKSNSYYEDIARADAVLHSPFFRPPWGGVSVFQYFKLRKKYRVVLWDVVSNDSNAELVDTDIEIQRLQQQVHNGSIILFHFVDKHAENTKRLLEPFIAMAISKGFSFDVLKNK
jgi:peptidoglycan/xylan/chitin deacetylase (PgdA/CDA1 family)